MSHCPGCEVYSTDEPCPGCGHAVEIAQLQQKDAGIVLYLDLARRIIDRILETDAKCDPPGDIELRVASIIYERDSLRAHSAAQDVEIVRLQGTLVRIATAAGISTDQDEDALVVAFTALRTRLAELERQVEWSGCGMDWTTFPLN